MRGAGAWDGGMRRDDEHLFIDIPPGTASGVSSNERSRAVAMVEEKMTVLNAMYLQNYVVADLTKLADDVTFWIRVNYKYLCDSIDC